MLKKLYISTILLLVCAASVSAMDEKLGLDEVGHLDLREVMLEVDTNFPHLKFDIEQYVGKENIDKITKITFPEDADRVKIGQLKNFTNLKTLIFRGTRYMSEKVLNAIPNWVTNLNLEHARKMGNNEHLPLNSDDLKPIARLKNLEYLNLSRLNLETTEVGIIRHTLKNLKQLEISAKNINVISIVFLLFGWPSDERTASIKKVKTSSGIPKYSFTRDDFEVIIHKDD